MPKYDDKGTLAEQAGLVAKRQDVNKPEDSRLTDVNWGDIDPGSIARKGGMDVVTDVQARELETDRIAVDARRKIEAILAEDSPNPNSIQHQYEMTGTISGERNSTFDELAATVPWEANPFQTFTGGMEETVRTVATDLVHQGYQGNPNEASLLAESVAGTPRQQTGSWHTSKKAAKMKGSGKTIPIWQVIDEASGIELPKKFRMQAPAERVATVLNQTGNVNDSRIPRISESHDRYIRVLREMRNARKMLKEGNGEFETQLQDLQFEAEELGMILGI
jgi:hypothetical protein